MAADSESKPDNNPRWPFERAVLAAGITPAAKLLMLTLLTRVGPKNGLDLGHFSPGVQRLNEETGLDRKTVMDHLNLLIEHGWLTRQVRGPKVRLTLSVGRPFAVSKKQVPPVLLTPGVPVNGTATGRDTSYVYAESGPAESGPVTPPLTAEKRSSDSTSKWSSDSTATGPVTPPLSGPVEILLPAETPQSDLELNRRDRSEQRELPLASDQASFALFPEAGEQGWVDVLMPRNQPGGQARRSLDNDPASKEEDQKNAAAPHGSASFDAMLPGRPEPSARAEFEAHLAEITR